MHSIAKNIKMIRKEKGWTQQQMADFLFVTRQTVSNWENGRALPDLETIEQISEKLDIDSQYLLYGKLTEEKYRKLNSLTATLVMTALTFSFLIIEMCSNKILSRISEYAGYFIFGAGAGYGDLLVGVIIAVFGVLWMIVLMINWAVADSNFVIAKIIKGCTNLFLSCILLYSSYSMVTDCLYTYRRYQNVVVKAHRHYEMTDEPYGFFTYRHGSLESIASSYAYNLAYIDNNDAQTYEFMDYLVNSQALKISRFEADSDFAQWLMREHNFDTVPAVLIFDCGNVEVLEGYEEISTKLESKIHNYKTYNIFFY